MAGVLIKKLYLDKREEEKALWQLQPADVLALKDQVLASVDFQNNKMSLLKRKAEIICSCYRDTQNYQELII